VSGTPGLFFGYDILSDRIIHHQEPQSMTYQKFLRWVIANLDLVPAALGHASEIWDRIEAGDESGALREAGEFLIWLSTVVDSIPEMAVAGDIEAKAADYQAIEAAGISLGDLALLWSLIQLLIPLLTAKRG
jgi:hypothetical protein